MRRAGAGHAESEKAGIPLYLDKEGNGDNMVNSLLWNMLMGAPLIAILAAAVGYLATAQALLARLETSVAIWFLLLVIYHVIRRWMLIQRRRLAFDRAKHRRAEMLAQRARGEEEPAHSSSPEGAVDIDESEIDLDAISAQSLRLVRSILMLIALLSVIVLWSEIHSAFGFWRIFRCGMSPLRCKAWKARSRLPRGGAHCDSGLYHHHAVGA